MAVVAPVSATRVTPAATRSRAQRRVVLAVVAAAIGAGLLAVVTVASHGLVLIPAGVALGLVAIQEHGSRRRAARLAPYMSEHAPHLVRNGPAPADTTP
jgi:hypothetical protein